MALKFFKENSYNRASELLKMSSVFLRHSSDFANKIIEDIHKARKKDDLPVEMKNPFATENPKCILCKYDIEPNFRNVRLLSQFVSSFTGRIYGRHITGLCKHKQRKVKNAIKKAQTSGLMGYRAKNPNFLADPDLYDFTKPFKVL